MMNIADEHEALKQRIVAFIARYPMAPSRLAEIAGLNKNSLARVGEPDWRPRADTLRKANIAIRKLEENGE